MQVNPKLIKCFNQVAEKATKLFGEGKRFVQSQPELLKGIDLTKAKINLIKKDVFKLANEAVAKDGIISKIQKFLENNYTTLVQYIQKFRAKDLKLDFKTVKA